MMDGPSVPDAARELLESDDDTSNQQLANGDQEGDGGLFSVP